MIDTTLLKKNEDYNLLVPTYVIFFTEKDIFGDGCPLHHYVMKEMESNVLLGDERHIIFVNGENNDEETALGRLVHDFKCNSADNMYYNVLADRVRCSKEEGGVQNMCKLLEDMRNEVARETAKKVARETAILTTIETARYLELSEDKIKKMVMEKYNLDENTADSYLMKKGA